MEISPLCRGAWHTAKLHLNLMASDLRDGGLPRYRMDIVRNFGCTKTTANCLRPKIEQFWVAPSDQALSTHRIFNLGLSASDLMQVCSAHFVGAGKLPTRRRSTARQTLIEVQEIRDSPQLLTSPRAYHCTLSCNRNVAETFLTSLVGRRMEYLAIPDDSMT